MFNALTTHSIATTAEKLRVWGAPGRDDLARTDACSGDFALAGEPMR